MDRAQYERGLAVRREMLGAEYVDGALDSAGTFGEPFQDLVNEFCYGAVWARPGMPRATRSLLTLVILCALNRPDELRMHLRAALRNGTAREDILEAFLQVTLYCGMPAGRDAFAAAKSVFAVADAEGK
jgi:4-carboxymuconolactone decarboxylase